MKTACLLKTSLRTALAAAALLAAAPAGAAEVSEAEVKAAYIYNFTRFVEWEKTAVSSAPAHFDICALGKDPVNAPLSHLPETEVLGLKTRVRLLGEDESGLASCRILFIGRSLDKRAPAIARSLVGRGALTVSSMPGFAGAGGVIGFSTEKGRVKLEINLRAAREAGVRINYRLLELSRVIRDGP